MVSFCFLFMEFVLTSNLGCISGAATGDSGGSRDGEQPTCAICMPGRLWCSYSSEVQRGAAAVSGSARFSLASKLFMRCLHSADLRGGGPPGRDPRVHQVCMHLTHPAPAACFAFFLCRSRLRRIAWRRSASASRAHQACDRLAHMIRLCCSSFLADRCCGGPPGRDPGAHQERDVRGGCAEAGGGGGAQGAGGGDQAGREG